MVRSPKKAAPDPLQAARAFVEAGNPQAAVALLQAQGARGGLLARLALGRALLAAGEIPQALDVLRQASALAPGIADAALALGEGLLAAGHLPTAIAELQRALKLDPTFEKAEYTLGCAWLEAGEADRASDILAKLAASASPLAPAAAQKLSEADAMRQAARAAPGYVRHLFDQFSDDYDARMLGTLSYRAPRILRELAEMILPAAPNSLAVLDLGCGTGLAGEAFKTLARRLDGIDLSPRMIEKASARGIYDELSVGDLEIALHSRKRRYDLIIAADTLVYLGDLAPVFAGVAERLEGGGCFLFTVESKSGEAYELGPKRRYHHSESYLRQEAARARLDVMGLMACTPRYEANLPVEGFAVCLQQATA